MNSVRPDEVRGGGESTAADLIEYIRTKMIGRSAADNETRDSDGTEVAADNEVSDSDGAEVAADFAIGDVFAGSVVGGVAKEILQQVHTILLYVTSGFTVFVLLALMVLLVCYQRGRSAEVVDANSRSRLMLVEANISTEHQSLVDVAHRVDASFDQLQRQLRGLDAQLLLAHDRSMSRSTMTLNRSRRMSGLLGGGRAVRHNGAITAAASLLSRCLEVGTHESVDVEEGEEIVREPIEREPIYAAMKSRRE